MANPKIDEYGTKRWYLDGKLHRDEKNSHGEFLPAIEYANGSKRWYNDGKHHRTAGPAIEYVNGSKRWYNDGDRHRTDGPAVEDNYFDAWYINDKLHRIDGPAVKYYDCDQEYFINGQKITDAEEINRIDNYHQDRLAFTHSAIPVYSFGHTFFRKHPLLNIIKSYSMSFFSFNKIESK